MMSESILQDLQRGAAAFRAGDFTAALAICNDVLQRSPQDAEALHLRALALGRLGRTDEALAAYDLAVAVHPQKAAVLTNLGNALSAAGRLDEAIAAYRRAIAHDPNFANAWSTLGPVLNNTGDVEGAKGALREALRINPRHFGALNNLGVVFHKQRQYEDAIVQFDAALKVDGNFASALINRGIALEKINQIDAALADYRKAASLAPHFIDVQYQLAKALRATGDLNGAVAAFRKAVAIVPTRADIHRELAKLLWELGRSQIFLAELDKAIAATSDPALLQVRAELSLLTSDTEGARASAARLLSVQPQNVGALSVLARLARHEGKFQEACEYTRSAHGAQPDDFDVRHAYVEALLAAGEYGEAVAILDCEPPPAHLQKHIALKALAWRALGDPAYKLYYDYDRFAAKLFIEPPAGYASIEEFNAAVEAALTPLHGTAAQPIDQTLYGGTQSFGRLWDNPHPVIQSLKDALVAASRRYIRSLPDDPSHPFLARKTEDVACAGSWSVILHTDGGHVDHFHPAGWISATYYVRVPPEVSGGEKGGFLRLGASGVAGLDLPAERFMRPEEGAVIFFPSYMWHGVEPFKAASPRIAAPFDLAPR